MDLSLDVAYPEPRAGLAVDYRKRVFLTSLLLSTWLPMIFFLALGHLNNPHSGLDTLKAIIIFVGASHVQASLFFYTDRNFRSLLRADKLRYVYLPLAAILISGVIFTVAGPAQAYLLLFYWAWQAYHYGRQNVGIYAFVSIAESQRSAPRSERWCLEAATFCGMLGTLKVLGSAIAPLYLRGLFEFLFQLGFYGFLILFSFSAFTWLRNFERTTLTKTLFFITLIIFFFPMYMSGDAGVTFLSYAIAHGFQYLVFMTVVAANTDRGRFRTSAGNVLKVCSYVIVLGLVTWYAPGLSQTSLGKSNVMLSKSFDFLAGAVLGTGLAHFIIDAGAWRLSRPSTRAYMIDRFGFIFGRNVAEANVETSLTSSEPAEQGHLPSPFGRRVGDEGTSGGKRF